MTFEQFQATGRDVSDLGTALSDASLAGVPGRLYRIGFANLYAIRFGGEPWSAIIGNQEHISANLVDIERVLYGFARSEGIA